MERNVNQFIADKLKNFVDNNGYIPKMFNPYNRSEIKDVSPTLLTNCGGLTVSSTVLIISKE